MKIYEVTSSAQRLEEAAKVILREVERLRQVKDREIAPIYREMTKPSLPNPRTPTLLQQLAQHIDHEEPPGPGAHNLARRFLQLTDGIGGKEAQVLATKLAMMKEE